MDRCRVREDYGLVARRFAVIGGAFIVQQDALFGTNRALVIKLATQHRLPSMSVVWVAGPSPCDSFIYNTSPV